MQSLGEFTFSHKPGSCERAQSFQKEKIASRKYFEREWKNLKKDPNLCIFNNFFMHEKSNLILICNQADEK